MRLFRVAILVLLASIYAVAPAQSVKGKRWAILIGIDSYEDKSLAPLQFAVADAKLMENTLNDAGFDRVVLLTSDSSDPSQQPKRATILGRLAQMAELIKSEDTFLFYFAGHGFSDDKTRKSYLTTSDCQSTLLKETGLPMELLQERMEQVKALHRVFLVDACRNDPFKGGRAGSNVRNKDLSRDLIQAAAAAPPETSSNEQSGTAVLWACSLGERSWEVEEKGHGAFTYFVAEGLKNGTAREADGSVSPYSLISYVQDQMEAWSLKMGKKQRPDWQSEGKAKFPLMLSKPGPVTPPKKDPVPDPKPNPTPKKDPPATPLGKKLRRSALVGQTTRYSIKTTFEVPEVGTATMTALYYDKIAEVSEDGGWVAESNITNGQVTIPGMPANPMPAVAPTKTTYNGLGMVTDVDDPSGDPNAMRYAMLQALVFPDKPVKVGDTWRNNFSKDSRPGSVDAVSSYKVEALEKLSSFECYKITGTYRETSGPAPAAATGTFWISTKDGSLVKFVGTFKNAPLAEIGPLDMKFWLIREGVK